MCYLPKTTPSARAGVGVTKLLALKIAGGGALGSLFCVLFRIEHNEREEGMLAKKALDTRLM